MSDDKKPCARAGCSNMASRFPIIKVMAEGCVRGDHDPLELIVPLPTCQDCQPVVTAADLLSIEESRAKIRGAVLAMGRAAPDFATAWLEWGRIGGPAWRKFHEMRAKAAGGGTA